MRLRYMVFLCLMVLCVSWLPVANAGAPTWQAWLYNSSSGEMLLIDGSGIVQKTVILPKPSGYESATYPYYATVSSNGDRVAYVLTQVDNSMIVLVYHLYNNALIATYPLSTPQNGVLAGTSLSYQSNPEIFSSDGRFLAFSYHYDTNWTLLVLDTNTNSLIQTLTNTSVGVSLPSDAFQLPVPVYFDSNTVHTIIAPVAGDGDFELDGYEWDYGLNNTFEYKNIFRNFQFDIEPRTGEIIYPYRDTHFADRTNEIIGIGVHQNSVQVYSPALHQFAVPFYVNENRNLDIAQFIQNGELILTRDSSFDGTSPSKYIVINREGQYMGELPFDSLWMPNVFSTGEGFVFMAYATDLAPYHPTVAGAGSNVLVFVDTRTFGINTNNVGKVIYTGATDTYPLLVWAKDITLSNTPPDPNAWASTPGFSDAPANNNSLPPANLVGSGLYIGAQARVTPDGEGLNVRNSATVNATKLTQLSAGTLATVLDGPLYIDGLTWWQINANGVIGWAAEGDATELWLEAYSGTGSLPPAVNTLPPPPTPVAGGQLPAPVLYDPITDRTFYFDELNVNGSVIQIAFEWETLAGAKNYFFQLEKCDGTSACYYIYGNYVDFPSLFYDITPYGFGMYRWRAVAYSPQGQEGIYSDWNYFIYSN